MSKSTANFTLLIDELRVLGGAEAVAADIAESFRPEKIVAGSVEPMVEEHFFAELEVSCLARGKPIKSRFSGLMLCWHFFRSRARIGSNLRLHTGWRSLWAATGTTTDIYYCHTPPRFAYDMYESYLAEIALPLRPVFILFVAIFRCSYESRLANVDLVIANSQNVKDRISRFLQLESIVIPPPVRTEKYRWLGQHDFYLSTARLESYKRVAQIVDAFRSLPDHTLVVASGGSQLENLRELAKGHPNIRFTDWCDASELRDLMGNCIATLYIPIDEDFGMSPVESMAAGKPVIGVAQGGLLETVVDGETGYLIDSECRKQDLIDALTRLDAPSALAMREACVARAKVFSPARFRRKIADILEKSGVKL